MKRRRGEAAVGWSELAPLALWGMPRELENSEQGVIV
jgi:hypothetical protein